MAMRLLLAALCTVCLACDADIAAPVDFKILPDLDHMQMPRGATFQLVVHPAPGATVTWSSTDTNVVTVDQQGQVTAVAVGSAIVTARAGSHRDSVMFTVADNVVPMPDLALSIDSIVDQQSRQPVSQSAVRGTIEIIVRIDTPGGLSTRSVHVLLDGGEVCREELNGRERFYHRCALSTASHSDGQHAVRAEIRNTQGTTVASYTLQLTFANSPPKGATPTTSIAKVVDYNGNDVNPSAVSGFIQVIARTDVPPSLADGIVRVKFRNEIVCVEPFAGRQRFEHRCTFDTRRFPNGEARIFVESVRPDGVIFTSATSQPLLLAN